jgi:hypothetical protein
MLLLWRYSTGDEELSLDGGRQDQAREVFANSGVELVFLLASKVLTNHGTMII